MLTLHYPSYCTPVDFYEMKTGSQAFGGQEGLTVALVLEGECTLALHSGAIVAPCGSLLLARGVFVIACAGACKVQGVLLQGAAADEMAAQLKQPRVLDSENYPTAAGLVRWLVQRDNRLDGASGSELSYALLCRLAQPEKLPPAQPPLVTEALREIRENFGEVYGVEELAAGLGVSKSHLIRIFSAEMGMPPGRYLADTRIEAAKRLLLHPNYELETVAGLCGFSGANYFCRVFKKATGQTPSAWRKTNTIAASVSPFSAKWEESLYL